MTDLLNKLAKETLSIFNEVEEKKTHLSEIIISDISSKEKLEKVKIYILKLRVNNKNNNVNGAEFTKMFDGLNFNNVNLNDVTSFMETALSPAVRFSTLIDKIGELIRSDKLNEDQKVSKIGDLLI